MNPGENPTTRAGGKEIQRKVDPMRDLFNSNTVMNKIKEMLGEEEGKAFVTNTLAAIQRNQALSKAYPPSVVTGAFIAASLKLSLEPSLGQSALVPYAEKGQQVAQFQIMTKGYVQLAQRTGLYRGMNVTEIYDDELKGEDILSGEVKIEPVDGGWRSKAKAGDEKAALHVAGYAAYFELLNGFRKVEYWSVAEIDAHGKKFSKSYNFAGGPWQAHRPAMRAKTVLKALITRWGPMTTHMAQAVRMDGGKGLDMNLTTVEPDDTEFFVQDDTQMTDEDKALKAGVPDNPEDDGKVEPSTAVPEKDKDGLGIF